MPGERTMNRSFRRTNWGILTWRQAFYTSLEPNFCAWLRARFAQRDRERLPAEPPRRPERRVDTRVVLPAPNCRDWPRALCGVRRPVAGMCSKLT
jgi:hypothetical protein